MSRTISVALLGNPNSGKTTLFNCLTGSNQRVGNWPGVTVEQQRGRYKHNRNLKVNVVDLPGCYSLVATADMPLDEKITCEYLSAVRDSVYINVVDATNLGRDLYLSLQLLELGLPVVVALNCMDLAKKRGLKIDINALSISLGCPVIPISAKDNRGIMQLKNAVASVIDKPLDNEYVSEYPQEVQQSVAAMLPYVDHGYAVRALEGDILVKQKLEKRGLTIAENQDILIATQRRKMLKKILQTAIIKTAGKETNISKLIDSIVLSPTLGPVVFLSVMYMLFVFAINLGGGLQLIFEEFSETLFVDSTASLLTNLDTPNWIINILANGVGKGISITVTFVPVLAAMFLFLSILESSGYMVRAAFLIDRLMRFFGLPGKSFVSMIVGFGCNVPAVMGSRTLSSTRERILTIMMTPFMSCSARLAVYAIFVAAFFPVGGHNIIFSLYLVGVLVAIFTGIALRTSILDSERTMSIIEMPSYKMPTWRVVFRQVSHRVKGFIARTGLLIIGICVIINGIGAHNIEQISRFITPIFAPIGIAPDNWPATVGLLTGVIAKEAVVGSLNAMYHGSGPEMVQAFGGAIPAYSYLLFTLLYFPCASFVAAVAKELNKKWAAFCVIWATGLAYLIAALFYQTATWTQHSLSSTLWIFGVSGLFVVLVVAARWMVKRDRVQLVPTPISLSL